MGNNKWDLSGIVQTQKMHTFLHGEEDFSDEDTNNRCLNVTSLLTFKDLLLAFGRLDLRNVTRCVE